MNFLPIGASIVQQVKLTSKMEPSEEVLPVQPQADSDCIDLQFKFTKSSVGESPTIRKLAEVNNTATYLEIGALLAHTFNNVNAPYKVGVDRNFRFNTGEYANENTIFHPVTSDRFLPSTLNRMGSLISAVESNNIPPPFEIIDYLKTYIASA